MTIKNVCIAVVWLLPAAVGWAQESKPVELFNGNDLSGWTASTDHWKVIDGMIVATTTADNPVSGYSNLVWKDGKVADFELTLKFRITGDRLANAGILFRCQEAGGFFKGYEAGIDQRGVYVGSLCDAMTSRGTLATRGQLVTFDAAGERKYETFARLSELKNHFNKDDWNDYKIVAKGNQIVLVVNGKRFAEVRDEDKENFDSEGQLVLQVKGDKTMTIEFKNVQLKRF